MFELVNNNCEEQGNNCALVDLPDCIFCDDDKIWDVV